MMQVKRSPMHEECLSAGNLFICNYMRSLTAGMPPERPQFLEVLQVHWSYS